MLGLRAMETDLDQLPRKPIDRLTKQFARFLRVEAAGGVLLLLCAISAVVLSNSPWGLESIWETPLGFHIGSFEFTRSLREWINDGAMTLFFFVVALELKRAIVLGELRKPRMAALSIAGALGGMLVPAGIYLLLQGGEPASSGWGTVMATDTAFVIGCLAILGPRVPHSLRMFMLALAIVDDIGAILVVAIGYSTQISWIALALAGFGVALVLVMAVFGIRGTASYLAAGTLIWLAVDASGIHATVTGVILGLLTPARRWVSDNRLYAILERVVAHPSSEEGGGQTKDRETVRLAERAARETLSPVERLEMILHPWVGFVVMPVFALANAGVAVSWSNFRSPINIGVIVAFVVGKPIGILAFCWLAVLTGLAARPANLGWRLLAGGGMLAGIGFTMALFIADLAFPPEVLGSVKLGIFAASILSGILGTTFLLWSTPRQARHAVIIEEDASGGEVDSQNESRP